jgi:hypothetical protein
MKDIEEIIAALLKFRNERDWEQSERFGYWTEHRSK